METYPEFWSDKSLSPLKYLFSVTLKFSVLVTEEPYGSPTVDGSRVKE